MSKTLNHEGKPELFFGLVAPLGADTDFLQEILESALKDVGYNVEHIRLSDLLREVWKKPLPKRSGRPLDLYINALQNAGDKFRDKCKSKDAFSYLCVAKIRALRKIITSDYQKPAYGTAYIITSLKTPEEYKTLNRIYGDAFFLIGTTGSRNKRVDYLSKKIAISRHSTGDGEDFREHAEKLIKRDYKDNEKEFGQNVQNTFPFSSLFVDSNNKIIMKREVGRLIEIIFGYQFNTPSIDEYMMYHAHAAALRSSDLSRQVGAAISTDNGHLLTVGTNEVPKAFGGLYWESDANDERDFKRGEDANFKIKMNMVADILDRLKKEKFLHSDYSRKRIHTITKEIFPYLEKAEIMDIGEFGRTVHAEMSALLDASNRGVSVNGAILYTTTFPCHNCTKHILAAGIKKVIYIEPYPKSKALLLHCDAMQIDEESDNKKVSFMPFVGISPKSYLKCFTKIQRKDSLGNIMKWSKNKAFSKILDLPEFSYIPYEIAAIVKLDGIRKLLQG